MSNAKRDGPAEAAAGGGGVRERLLDAALAILRESGLRRLTQVRVAERAGVRQSHLTYYFPTREDLLAGVTARAVQGIADHVGHAVRQGGGAGDGPLLERLAAAIADVEHMRMFVGMIVEADSDPALRALLARGTQHLEAAIADALGGEGAEERARLLLIALWGLGLHHFALRPPPKSDPIRSYLTWVGAAAAEPSRGRGKSGRSRRPTTRE